MESYDLFAVGLGLIFSSAGALRTFGTEGSPIDREVHEKLFQKQKIFLLATGSPELNYKINVYRESWPLDVAEGLERIVEASLLVEGGTLVIRDGYDLEEWVEEPSEVVSVRLDDGHYRVKIGNIHSESRHGFMVIHVLLEKGEGHRESVEMVDLPFRSPQ